MLIADQGQADCNLGTQESAEELSREGLLKEKKQHKKLIWAVGEEKEQKQDRVMHSLT